MAGNLEAIFGPGGFNVNRDSKPFEVSPESQLRTKIREGGIQLPLDFIIDGQLHKFNIDENDKRLSGWYVFHKNSFGFAGCAGDYKNNLKVKTKTSNRPLSMAEALQQEKEIEQAQKEADIKEKEYHLETARQVQVIFENAEPVLLDHPYIIKKKLKGTHGAKIYNNMILTPLYDANGFLWTVERIYPDGKKLAWKGGSRKEHFWLIGNPSQSNQIVMAEGFATAATIHEQTGHPAVVAYSAGGIYPVAGVIHDLYPEKFLTIACDRDSGKVSETEGYRAQADYGCRVVVAPESDISSSGSDFNDYYVAGGDITPYFKMEEDPWLKSANDLIKKPTYVKWMIKHWWQQNALIMVHGPSGSGKTFLVLDMALNLATEQEDWNGYKINACPVVYLAGEGHYGIAQRLKAWSQEKEVKEINNFWVSRSGTDLNTNEGLSFVMNQINSLPKKPGLIIYRCIFFT